LIEQDAHQKRILGRSAREKGQAGIKAGLFVKRYKLSIGRTACPPNSLPDLLAQKGLFKAAKEQALFPPTTRPQ
jgi:hypothetical protein